MANPVQIEYGDYPIKTRSGAIDQELFDPIRRKWVMLTPEEWVRQNWIHWLQDHGISINRIKVEHTLRVLGQSRRADIVVFSREYTPWLIVECKAPEVRLHQPVFDQVARYNLTLQVPYLIVTNGDTTYACKIDYRSETYKFIDYIPEPG